MQPGIGGWPHAAFPDRRGLDPEASPPRPHSSSPSPIRPGYADGVRNFSLGWRSPRLPQNVDPTRFEPRRHTGGGGAGLELPQFHAVPENGALNEAFTDWASKGAAARASPNAATQKKTPPAGAGGVLRRVGSGGGGSRTRVTLSRQLFGAPSPGGGLSRSCIPSLDGRLC